MQLVATEPAVFPELKEPTVFVASPGDVADMRRAAANEFEALRARVANDLGIGMYRWEVDKSEDGFDDSVPVQEQIYLPSDPLRRAGICVLAEKLGMPLDLGIPLHSLANAVYLGDFEIEPTGLPMIMADEPLLGALPARINKPVD